MAVIAARQNDRIPEDNFWVKALACTPFIGTPVSFFAIKSIWQRIEKLKNNPDGLYQGNRLQARELKNLSDQFRKCAIASSILELTIVVTVVAYRLISQFNPYVFTAFLVAEAFMLARNFVEMSIVLRDREMLEV